MDAQNNKKNGQTKERKLSLSFIRKSFVRKTTSNETNTTRATTPPPPTININDENTPFVVNGHETDYQIQRTHTTEKGRKNIFKNLKKKMHLTGSFVLCRSKQKLKNTDTTSDESTSQTQTQICTRSNCDNKIPSSRVPNVDTSSNYVLNEDCDCDCDGPEVPPRETRRNINNRPADLVIYPPMVGMAAPDDSPLELSSNSSTLLETEPSAGTSLIRQLGSLAYEGWYWGPLTRQEAEEKLHDQPDGAFLIRDSSSDNYVLSISFRSSGKTLHTRIEHSHGMFSFYAQDGFSSITELVNHSMSFSQKGVYCYSRPRSPTQPAFPVRLTKPLSRFMKVRSLQYLCRFVIRRNTRFDNIQKLPLPKPIRGYIEEGLY